jgi:hypothetical protein
MVLENLEADFESLTRNWGARMDGYKAVPLEVSSLGILCFSVNDIPYPVITKIRRSSRRGEFFAEVYIKAYVPAERVLEFADQNVYEPGDFPFLGNEAINKRVEARLGRPVVAGPKGYLLPPGIGPEREFMPRGASLELGVDYHAEYIYWRLACGLIDYGQLDGRSIADSLPAAWTAVSPDTRVKLSYYPRKEPSGIGLRLDNPSGLGEIRGLRQEASDLLLAIAKD